MTIDPLVAALARLCSKVGGYKAVALAVDMNDQTIYQIVSGVKMPSGNAKSVGSRLRGKLDEAFPDWRDEGEGSMQGEASNVGQPLTLQGALELVAGAIDSLAPMLQSAGTDQLRAWLDKKQDSRQAAETIAALNQASKSLPKIPASVESAKFQQVTPANQ